MRLLDLPLAVAYGYPVAVDDFEFVGRAGLIRFSGCQNELARILPLCNGLRTVEEIAQRLADIDKRFISRLLGLCKRHDLVVDSRQLYSRFHLDSANPAQFRHDLSIAQVERLQRKAPYGSPQNQSPSITKIELSQLSLLEGTMQRRSIRSFTGKSPSKYTLLCLLASLYRREATRSVPSAGALYPLQLFLMLLKGIGPLEPAVYTINETGHQLSYYTELPVSEEIFRVFDTRELLEHAAAIVVVASDMSRSPKKYANRGYRYTLIEAGHVAQNAYLFSSTKGAGVVGVVEYGGFLDKELAALLKLRYPAQAPLITLICGVPARETATHTEVLARENLRVLKDALVGERKPIAAFGLWKLEHRGLSMPRWAAVAHYRHPGRLYTKSRRGMRAYATSPLSYEALVKVVSEAYERFACQVSPQVVLRTADELAAPYVNPDTFVPYNADHPIYERYRLTPFSSTQQRGWRVGQRHSDGRRIFAPCDLLYFERPKGQKVWCYRPNSSGVAAHPDSNCGIENGFLELVERDAIAVSWYARRTPIRINDDALQPDLVRLKNQWERRGWEVFILDITLEALPVCLVLFTNRRGQYPQLASGAGCAIRIEAAAAKAFAEAEYMALSWMKRRNRRVPVTDKIRSPDEHGLLHATGSYLDELEHLFDAPIQDPKTAQGDLEQMFRLHSPVVVRLDQGGSPLKVIRVLSATLLPLTFGYATEHYGHPRLSMVGFSWERPFPSLAHFFP